MPDIATNEPLQHRAGLTWEWERQDLSDYPAPTWTLTYWFKRQGGTDKFSIEATANGVYHRVDVAPATTAAYVADDYTWAAIVTDGTDTHQVDSGSLKILPRYDQDTALDDRTHAKKVLEAIEAVIEGRASKDQEQYTIGNRSLQRTPLAELIKLRSFYRNEVASEAAAERLRNGLGTGANIQVRL